MLCRPSRSQERVGMAILLLIWIYRFPTKVDERDENCGVWTFLQREIPRAPQRISFLYKRT